MAVNNEAPKRGKKIGRVAVQRVRNGSNDEMFTKKIAIKEGDKKNMKNTNWKVPVIITAGVVAVILMIIFCVQSSENKAISLEEQVNTAHSDIKVQEKS